MNTRIPRRLRLSQSSKSTNSVFSFEVENAVPQLREKGFALLPGCTNWLARLRPTRHPRVWQLLEIPQIVETLRAAPQQRLHFGITDEGAIDEGTQTVAFSRKPHKTHLSIFEGAQSVLKDLPVPDIMIAYLWDCLECLSMMRTLLEDSLRPTPPFQTVLALRVFWYHTAAEHEGMREHVDGSLATVILGDSDGCLHLKTKGGWQAAVREHSKPFTMLIPGRVAVPLFGIPATRHKVQSTPDRESLTAFLLPDLGSSRLEAQGRYAAIVDGAGGTITYPDILNPTCCPM